MDEMRSQGTQLYLLDVDASPDEVVKIGNVDTMPEVGGEAGDIDTTNFDNLVYKSFLAGLIDPGTGEVRVNYSKEDDSHQRMRDIQGGDLYWWAVGLRDGVNVPPTVSGGEFVLPTNRTWLVFQASVKSAKLMFEKDSIVRMNVGLRLSGEPVLTRATT